MDFKELPQLGHFTTKVTKGFTKNTKKILVAFVSFFVVFVVNSLKRRLNEEILYTD